MVLTKTVFFAPIILVHERHMKDPGERDVQSALQNEDVAFQATGVQPYFPQMQTQANGIFGKKSLL